MGAGEFGADRLAQELVKRDIEVIEIWGEGEELKIKREEVDYVFDFWGREEISQKFKGRESRVVIVCINNNKKAERIKKEKEEDGGNWRLIEAKGVYGPRMEEVIDGSNQFLVEAIELAVLNKNLILPPTGKKVRVLAIGDVVEVAIRAMMVRGTERKEYLVAGGEISSKEIAEELMSEAKMTRVKVVTEEMEIEELESERIEESREELRWEPEVEFKEGIRETLQYFFSRVEEERRSRKKKPEIRNQKAKIRERKEEGAIEEDEKRKREEKKWYEVVVEEGKSAADKEIENENETVIEDSYEEEAQLEMEVEKKEEKEEKYEKKKTKRVIVWGFLGMGIIGITILGSWVGWGYKTMRDIRTIGRLIEAGEYEKAKDLAVRDEDRLRKAEMVIDQWRWNRWGWGRELQEWVRGGKEAAELGQRISRLAKSAKAINGAIFEGKEIDWEKSLSEVKKEMEETSWLLGRLETRLKIIKVFPAILKTNKKRLADEIKETRGTLEKIRQLLPAIPALIGINGERREYLVVFQNENELRPGGGFIGSYAIVSFDDGKLAGFNIHDIYEADGQLKGHVEPPEEIKKHLGEAGWYLRDSNWQASWMAGAAEMQWFFEKETGRKVDGVIGMNLSAAKAILGVTGEVFVPDFKEKVNKDNIYEQAQYYAENKFFPGSKQKVSFLSALGQQLYEEIRNLIGQKTAELGAAMIRKLDEREIQVAVNQKEVGKIMASLGWDGEIYQGRCGLAAGNKSCVADYLMVVEANFGVNKANFFVKRNIEEAVTIKEGEIGRVLRINYENTAKNSNWPGGDYKNYLRLYLPSEVGLETVTIGQEGAVEKLGSDRVKVRLVAGKKEVGFLVVVPVSQKRTVEIRYNSAVNLGQAKELVYLNYIQKQSGFGETGVVKLITIPEGWQVSLVEPEATMVGGKVLFNLKLDKDIKMGVEINK